jgi:hypothetical protein
MVGARAPASFAGVTGTQPLIMLIFLDSWESNVPQRGLEKHSGTSLVPDSFVVGARAQSFTIGFRLCREPCIGSYSDLLGGFFKI